MESYWLLATMQSMSEQEAALCACRGGCLRVRFALSVTSKMLARPCLCSTTKAGEESGFHTEKVLVVVVYLFGFASAFPHQSSLRLHSSVWAGGKYQWAEPPPGHRASVLMSAQCYLWEQSVVSLCVYVVKQPRRNKHCVGLDSNRNLLLEGLVLPGAALGNTNITYPSMVGTSGCGTNSQGWFCF